MREIRTSGSVEGVMGNCHSYSDSISRGGKILVAAFYFFAAGRSMVR
jgi:hypothetical protein